ncbi:type I restriction endonuclease [Stenotrophomonas sp. LGBM10]|uniref:type I restriction endonuclease n=1 Tax=Stenotrophomonas sp. LGBM10 TaxID=3390038 RepID=UPI00398BA39A
MQRSALGWLLRLGWRYLPRRRLRGQESVVLMTRLRHYLQGFRFAHGEDEWPLSETAIKAVVATVLHAAARGPHGAAHGLQTLLHGTTVEDTLPDGERVTVNVPLVDWTDAAANCFDVRANVPLGPQPSGSPRVLDLVAYVNGLPLALVVCSGRDAVGRWARDDDAIARHLAFQRDACDGDPYVFAQLLLALDRRGGRYAAPGTPATGWRRWQERPAGSVRAGRLFVRPGVQAALSRDGLHGIGGPVLRGVHAGMLSGLLAPARLLGLLRCFTHAGPDGRRHVAHAGQFGAVQAVLSQLRTGDARGRRNGGQVCLSSGSGLRLTAHWLLAALRQDPELRGCRVLHVATGAAVRIDQRQSAVWPMPPRVGSATLTRFLRGDEPGPVSASLYQVLRARHDLPAHDGGHDVVLWVDAGVWSRPMAVRARLRAALPRSAWLTLSRLPVAVPVDGDTSGQLLFAYSAAEAVDDGVTVPVFHASRAAAWLDAPAGSPAARSARIDGIAADIARHLVEQTRCAERRLLARLVVCDEERPIYQAALQRAGRVSCIVQGGRLRAVEDAEVELVAANAPPGPSPASHALLYVDALPSAQALAAAVSAINAPHADKHHAVVIDYQGLPKEAEALIAAATSVGVWPMQSADTASAALPRLHARLYAPLAGGSGRDFHAARRRLGPAPPGTHADPALARSRRRFHERVTHFGEWLQAAQSTSTGTTGGDGDGIDGTDADPSHGYPRDLHFCSVLRDAINVAAAGDAGYTAADIRIRHWARHQAPELREPLMDYATLRELENAATPPEADSDAVAMLYQRLQREGEQALIGDAFARRQWDAALTMALAGAGAHRELLGVAAAWAHDQRPDLPVALPPARGIRACYGVLRLALEDSIADPDAAPLLALAEELDAVVQKVRRELPRLPHLFRVALHRCLHARVTYLVGPVRADAVLAGLIEMALTLPADAAP